jgi:hypothetical protein
LGSLPETDRQRVLDKCRMVRLERGWTVGEPRRPLTKAYFPADSVCSTVACMRDGTSVEALLTGREGMSPLPLILGAARTLQMRVFSQVSGDALEMSADAFADEMQSCASFRDAMERFAGAAFAQVVQTVACNRLHSIEERCARWLLMTHDRVVGNDFDLTQEFLAEMLGVRRPSVTVAAGMLQKAGMIRYRRGSISILDRTGLEASTCECYETICEGYENAGLSLRARR